MQLNKTSTLIRNINIINIYTFDTLCPIAQVSVTNIILANTVYILIKIYKMVMQK